jgi:hypothetical protein
MNFPHSRSKPALCLAVVLLALGLISSCQPTSPPQEQQPPPRTDPREEFARSLKGANVSGYIFETTEDDKQSVTSLTNSAVRSLIRMDGDTKNVVLRYTSVKDKGSNATKTYKAEVNRDGNALTLLVTDFATGAVISKDPFPVAQPHDPAGPTFNTVDECFDDFNCKRRGAILCEANRTCKPQFASVTCCLPNGQCFIADLIIMPTSRKCVLVGNLPDLEGFVLSRP